MGNLTLNFLKQEKVLFQSYDKEVMTKVINERMNLLKSFTKADEGLFIIQNHPGSGTLHQLKEIYKSQESAFIDTAFDDFFIRLVDLPKKFVLVDADSSMSMSKIILPQVLEAITKCAFQKAVVVTYEDELTVKDIMDTFERKE